MHQHHRWLAAALALILALVLAAPALAVTPEDYNKNLPQNLEEGHLYADASVLIDGDTGEVLLAKNARARMYPASTTKVMTLMLALESGISLDTPIIIPKQAAQIPSDSSLVPVFPQDQMTFEDLLYGFMLTSGNDGANAIAVLVAGSVDAFVARMNARVTELGCEGTHFANAHGYHDEEHYTTALDMATIAREALKLDKFRQIVSTPRYVMHIQRGGQAIENVVRNTNALLKDDSPYYYADCIGVKTGYHSLAGQCFVGAAERDGVRLVTVDFHSMGSNDKWVDTIRLFNYGFTCYTAYTLDEMFDYASSQIATLKISNAIESDPYGGTLQMDLAQISNPDYIRMVHANSEEAMNAAIEDFVSRSELTITDDMIAPISKGEIMGRFRYVDQTGEEVTALLIATRSVEEQPPRMTLKDIFPFLRNFENPLFTALSIVLVLLVLLLIISGIARKVSRDRRRSRIYEARKEEYLRQRRMERRRQEKKRRRHADKAGAAKRAKRGGNQFEDDDDDEDDLFSV